MGDKRKYAKHKPANKLSADEVSEVVRVVTSPEYADLPPSQIVPKLADNGIYMASESTFYRILKREKLLAHRGRAKSPNRYRPKTYIATGPNQVWTWDITYLKTTIKGQFYYLYLILDIYSRKIVGFEIFGKESAAHASEVIKKAYRNENIDGKQIVLHADNGSPMKGATMTSTLQKLGIISSFSRPGVSNDNPYSESLFRTFKYRPGYPYTAFLSIEDAYQWVNKFVDWYNKSHCHSQLKFVTPVQRHTGDDIVIRKNREAVYEIAKKQNPIRWTSSTPNWTLSDYVVLNPLREKQKPDITLLNISLHQ